MRPLVAVMLLGSLAAVAQADERRHAAPAGGERASKQARSAASKDSEISEGSEAFNAPEASEGSGASGTTGGAGTANSDAAKKARWLAEKSSRRRDVRLRRSPRPAPPPRIVTLRNLWTHEVLAVDPARPPAESEVDGLLRCHFTNQSTHMDPRLLRVILGAARKFGATVVEIVSGYRAPKYNLMLRKKGHEVARDSQHPLGHAVDFRLPGLPVKKLLRFVRSLHLGGVGYYPSSAFVHADVGRVRYWRGH